MAFSVGVFPETDEADQFHTRVHPLKDRSRKEAELPASLSTLNLLQQFEYELLLLVSLGKSGNTGLLQNGILVEVGHGRRDVGSGDGVLSRRQVLHLAVDNVAGCGEPVDARTQRAANAGYVRDGRIDQGQRSLRVGLSVQIGSCQVHGAATAAVGDGRRREPPDGYRDLARSDGSR